MCGHGGTALRGTRARTAGASFLSPLAVGRQRLASIDVLSSRGPSSDSQAQDSPARARCVVRGYFSFIKRRNRLNTRRAGPWESSAFRLLQCTQEIKTQLTSRR